MSKKKQENEESSFGSWVLHIGTSILFGILFLFLATNILFAVSLPNIDEVVTGKNDSIVNFMKQGRSVSPFNKLLPEIKDIFITHEKAVYKDEDERNRLIAKLEKALVINPKSRDVLYSLYLLYDKSGETQKSAAYLKRAQEVDPKMGK